MTEKDAAYQAGMQAAKAMSVEDKIDAIYNRLFIDKDCFSVRVSSLEQWMKALGVIATFIIAPVMVALVLKVFLHI